MLYHCFSFCLVPDPLIPVGPAVRTFIPESSVVSRLLCVGHVVAVVVIVVLVATATAAAAAVAVLVEVEVVVALVVKTWRAYALSIVFFRSGNRFSAPGILELQICFVFFGFILASLLFCAASSSSSFSSFVLVSMVAALLFSCSNIHSNNKNPTTKMAGETHLKNSKQKAESSNSDGDEDNDDDDR
jgi:hypothetical protein